MKSGLVKTMCVGQPQSLCQREFRRLSPVNPLARRLLMALSVFATLALAPAVSRADFLGDTGLNQPLSSGTALPGQVTLVGDDSSLLDLFSGRTGIGSSSADREADPSKAPRNDDLPLTPKALAGNATGGCGSTSGSGSGGASASPLGIVNEIAAPVNDACSGRTADYSPLSLPSPIAARLLDPPRDAA